jgi:Zn finger protein HypA/HybF involved in hydrogenase expression
MNESGEKINSVQWKHKHIHCPICGNTNVKLVEGKGRFVGNAGGMIVCHVCENCNSSFIMIITGDEMFPDRGFDLTDRDLSIAVGKSA